MSQEFIAICPKGLELLLVDELTALGATEAHEKLGAVHFSGTLETAYRACLWSRLANRILMPLASATIDSEQELYELVQQIDWELHLGVTSTFKVDFRGTSRSIRHEQFGARRVKDAIADQFVAEQDKRPSVDFDDPDLLINCQLYKGQCRIAIDLSGHSLHQRGYRQLAGRAPIKENLAAALLIRAGLPELIEQQQAFAVIDPMAGSGTLLIEALLMAADIAPGLYQQAFGFSHWRGHQTELYESLVAEAEQRRIAGLQQVNQRHLKFVGFEQDGKTIQRAVENLKMAGLKPFIKLQEHDFSQQQIDSASVLNELPEQGLVISNPPYGERLGELHELAPVYSQLGKFMRQFTGYQGAIITSEVALAKQLAIHAHKQYAFYNGPLACKLYCFELAEKNYIVSQSDELSQDAEALANRISKNYQKFTKFAEQLPTEVYRIYDQDLPQYAFAIDVYAEHLYIQEYAAPKSVKPEVAKTRLFELMQVLPKVLPFEKQNIHLKVRKRQTGTSQYNKYDKQGRRFVVSEQGLKFYVNLTDYIDTGLFADHRKTRSLIRKQAQGKRFLNLFAYTGTATVYAAAGGAQSTTTVDLSNTYLKWAEDNLKLNNYSAKHHQFIKADCVAWLAKQASYASSSTAKKYDLIFMDPPSFSNSKSMDSHFDIQADHQQLIEQAMSLLSEQGILYFSTNRRGFKLAEALFEQFSIKPMGKKSISRDYVHQRLPHQAFEITHR